MNIIGHGPSPKGRGWGKDIDKNKVFRLKDERWEAGDWGKRCDYRASSTETMMAMIHAMPYPKAYFAQPKKGSWNVNQEREFREKAPAPLEIPLELFNRWNAVFHEFNSEIRNYSLGMFAIVVSADILKAGEICLVGFDNLLNPSLLEYQKADRGKWVTHHDWKAENKMLPLIEKEYGCSIFGMG